MNILVSDDHVDCGTHVQDLTDEWIRKSGDFLLLKVGNLYKVVSSSIVF